MTNLEVPQLKSDRITKLKVLQELSLTLNFRSSIVTYLVRHFVKNRCEGPDLVEAEDRTQHLPLSLVWCAWLVNMTDS